ncbi:MAG: lysyl endopeptidase, partial [Flavobacteriales bacterium]
MNKLRALAVACLVLGICALNPAFSQTSINVSFSTDCWGGESSWTLAGPGDIELVNIASGTYGNQTVYDSLIVDLPDGCYIYTVGDTYGDGLDGGGACAITGNYSITDDLGNVLVQMVNAAFGSSA